MQQGWWSVKTDMRGLWTVCPLMTQMGSRTSPVTWQTATLAMSNNYTILAALQIQMRVHAQYFLFLATACEFSWTLKPSKTMSKTSRLVSKVPEILFSRNDGVSWIIAAFLSTALNNTAWGMSCNVTALSHFKRHSEGPADTVTL